MCEDYEWLTVAVLCMGFPAGVTFWVHCASAAHCARGGCDGAAFSEGVSGIWLNRSALRVHAKALPHLHLRKRNGLQPCGLRVRAGFPAAAAVRSQFVQFQPFR